MAVPSPVGDVKYSVPNQYFRAKYIDTQIKCCFFCLFVCLFVVFFFTLSRTVKACTCNVVVLLISVQRFLKRSENADSL